MRKSNVLLFPNKIMPPFATAQVQDEWFPDSPREFIPAVKGPKAKSYVWVAHILIYAAAFILFGGK